MEKDRYYIAYGSNLNIPQMESRCPSASVHAVGRIPDYRLEFKALGTYAYATIEPCKGDYVPVVIWKISTQDEHNLDRYEGFPTHYYKEDFIVEAGNKTLHGMVYIMNENAVYRVPSRQNFQTVLEGYRSFGLEESQLQEAYYRAENMGTAEDNTLRFYRNMRSMTQSQLALQSGISIRAIQNYEGGGHSIANAKAQTVLKLAESLKIPMEKLIGVSNDYTVKDTLQKSRENFNSNI